MAPSPSEDPIERALRHLHRLPASAHGLRNVNSAIQILERVLDKQGAEAKAERRVLQTASEQAGRFQEQITTQKEIIDRLQRQLEWLLEKARKCNVDIAVEFSARQESGFFG